MMGFFATIRLPNATGADAFGNSLEDVLLRAATTIRREQPRASLRTLHVGAIKVSRRQADTQQWERLSNTKVKRAWVGVLDTVEPAPRLPGRTFIVYPYKREEVSR